MSGTGEAQATQDPSLYCQPRYYDYATLQRHISEHYPNELTYYRVPDGLYEHPSSWKYYSLVKTRDPKMSPIDIFNNHHELWEIEGCQYHPKIPAGGNTATTMLARRAMAVIAKKKKYCQVDYLKVSAHFP